MERRSFNSINIERPLACGSEALIFPTKDGFYKEFDSMTSIDSIKRKEEMLIYLEGFDILKKYYPTIKYLVDSPTTDSICGYVMDSVLSSKKAYGSLKEEIDNGGRLKLENMSFDELMSSLRDLLNILEQFRNNGLLYLDIRHPNIKLNSSSQPVLLDIDSITYLDRPVLNKIPADLCRYLACKGKMDVNAQIFMFNIFTIEAFGSALYSQVDLDSTGAKMCEAQNMFGQYIPEYGLDQEYLCNHIKGKSR